MALQHNNSQLFQTTTHAGGGIRAVAAAALPKSFHRQAWQTWGRQHVPWAPSSAFSPQLITPAQQPNRQSTSLSSSLRSRAIIRPSGQQQASALSFISSYLGKSSDSCPPQSRTQAVSKGPVQPRICRIHTSRGARLLARVAHTARSLTALPQFLRTGGFQAHWVDAPTTPIWTREHTSSFHGKVRSPKTCAATATILSVYH